MTGYVAEHQNVLADLAWAGAPVTFARSVLGGYNPATDSVGTATITAVTGNAIRVAGDPMVYQALGLVQSEAPTLFFAPDNYGDVPLPGDSVTWSCQSYTAKDIRPIAPDGVAIAAHIIIAR